MSDHSRHQQQITRSVSCGSFLTEAAVWFSLFNVKQEQRGVLYCIQRVNRLNDTGSRSCKSHSGNLNPVQEKKNLYAINSFKGGVLNFMEDKNDLTEGFVTWSRLFFCEVLGFSSTFLVSVGYKADNINGDTLKMPPEISFQVILKHWAAQCETLLEPPEAECGIFLVLRCQLVVSFFSQWYSLSAHVGLGVLQDVFIIGVKKMKKKKKNSQWNMHLGSRTFAKAALKFMLIKFLFCVCVERLEACRGKARQSYCRFFIFLFFISLFSCRLPSLKLSWVKSSHVMLRRSVWFSQVLFKLQKHLKWIRKMFCFFFSPL